MPITWPSNESSIILENVYVASFLADSTVTFISRRCWSNRLVCSRRYCHASEKTRMTRRTRFFHVFPGVTYPARGNRSFASVSIVSLLHRSRFLFTRGEEARWSQVRELICSTQRRWIKRSSFRYIWFVIYLIFPSRWGCNFPPSVTAASQSRRTMFSVSKRRPRSFIFLFDSLSSLSFLSKRK